MAILLFPGLIIGNYIPFGLAAQRVITIKEKRNAGSLGREHLSLL
jgi:hypothetical protein